MARYITLSHRALESSEGKLESSIRKVNLVSNREEGCVKASHMGLQCPWQHAEDSRPPPRGVEQS